MSTRRSPIPQPPGIGPIDKANRTCEYEPCKNSLEGKKINARFCSKRCSWLHWKENGSTGGVKSPSLGDKVRLENGYINIFTESGWKLEHRFVVEQVLGRPLALGETVHHRNGIRNDNREENLELWVTGHRTGNRGREITCPHCGETYSNI